MTSSRTAKPSPERFGTKIPRLYTKPLRALTPETSLGFEVIEFALQILGVSLYPWQEWLLIHALELNPDGTYRFRRVIVLVARQNGKSLLASVLAAWWLFVDSDRHPDRMPPVKFQILGTAQNLDTARDVWQTVRMWCDPEVDPAEDEVVVPALQQFVRRVSDTNGKEEIILKSKVRYLIRAASRKSGRGKSSPRTIMDEMREQLDWTAWDSISQTSKAMFSPQLWGFSNAGDARSVVLNHQRMAAMKFVKDWESYVDTGITSVEDFANGRDTSLGLFEWSAPEDCALDDVPGILQANPSIGHGEITVASVLADIEGMTESGFRTEVLCQWVTSMIDPAIDGELWQNCADPETEDGPGSVAAGDSPLVMGIDTSGNRAMSFISVAAFRTDGLVHGEVIAQRAGMLWVPDVAVKIRAATGITHVALQIRGCAAAEFADPLRELGFTIIEIAGTALGSSAGRIRDRVRDRSIRHRSQPMLDMAVSGGLTKRLGEVQVWDRTESVVDIAPLVALSNALYGLETMPPPEDNSSVYEDHDLMVV